VILGASHLTLAVDDVIDAGRTLSAYGFEERFVELSLPSHTSKSSFLSEEQTLHDLNFMGAKGGIAIELLRYYNGKARSIGNLLPIFDQATFVKRAAATDASDYRVQAVSEAFGCKVDLTSLPTMPPNSALVCGDQLARGGVVGAAINVSELDWAANRWELAVGVTCSSRGSRWARLDIPSPVSSWRCALVFCQRDWEQPAWLDSGGCSCLSILSNEFEKDRIRFSEASEGNRSGSFEQVIGGRNLQIEFYRLPDDVYIELVGLGRSGRG
jgi:hypothetical protein